MLIEIIGWLGTALILIAYFLISTKKITPGKKIYQWLNIIGAICIIINSLFHRAIPSVGLNIIWLFIAVYGLIKFKR